MIYLLLPLEGFFLWESGVEDFVALPMYGIDALVMMGSGGPGRGENRESGKGKSCTFHLLQPHPPCSERLRQFQFLITTPLERSLIVDQRKKLLSKPS